MIYAFKISDVSPTDTILQIKNGFIWCLMFWRNMDAKHGWLSCIHDSTFKMKNQILVPNIFVVQSYKGAVFLLKIKII